MPLEDPAPSIFPEIQHIDDILPAIEAKPEIRVQSHTVCLSDGSEQEFRVVCYQFSDKDTFDSPLTKECRGLVFDRSGRLVHRPFHKFFNLGESGGVPVAALDGSRLQAVLPKMDGSMVGFVPTTDAQGLLHWIPKTKKSFAHPLLTEMRKAPEFESGAVHRVLSECGTAWTPLFEFTAPTNRIVVRYPETHLSLLAVRHNRSGSYLSESQIEILRADTQYPGLPLCDTASIKDLLSKAATAKGVSEEGWVLVLDSGERVKVKTLEYLKLHKLLTTFSPKAVLEAWVDETLDDSLGFLRQIGDNETADNMEALVVEGKRRLSTVVATVEKTAKLWETRVPDLARRLKRFALEGAPTLPQGVAPLVFAKLHDREPPYLSYAKKYLIPGLAGPEQRQDQER